MAQLFKRNILSPIPAGATIIEKDGKRLASWKDGGRTRRAPLNEVGDKIVTGESARWQGKSRIGKPPHHTWKTVRLFADKTASERELVKLQTTEDQRAAGVITPEMEHAGKSLSVHIADYLAAMKQVGVSDDHYRISKWTLEELVAMSGWVRVSDLTADSLRVVISKLTADGYATNYVNKFTSRAKGLVHWMQQNGRISSDPLSGVKRGNAAKGKKTRARRAMEIDEAAALLAAAPADRRRKYLFAMLSGLRRGELADLRWNDLRLNATIPFIQLREEQTKNDKADCIPIHPALIRLLKELPAGEDHALVLGQMPDMKSMARDLLKAGLATLSEEKGTGIRIDKGKYVCIADARGRRTDFHSLRHAFKTWVDRTGCTEATSDALTRHGDKTVGDGYRHAELADMAEALRKIPDPSPVIAEQQQATGTDGKSADPRTTGRTIAHHGAHHEPGDHQQSSATIGDTPTPCQLPQLPYNAVVGDDWRRLATICYKSLSDNNLRPSTQVD